MIHSFHGSIISIVVWIFESNIKGREPLSPRCVMEGAAAERRKGFVNEELRNVTLLER